MNRRWFAALRRGIGWKPATWQGWIITWIYILLVIGDFFWVRGYSISQGEFLFNFILQFSALTILLAFICYFTGEKPRT